MLQLTSRTVTGKEVAKLREQGLVPATVYGANKESVSVEVPVREFKKIFSESGFSALVDAQVDGGKTQKMLIKEVQMHPVNDQFLSVSFFVTDANKEIHAEVPLKFVGTSPAEELNLGFVAHQISELAIVCLPDKLPHEIEVDISVLTEAGSAITIADIKLPEGVELDSKMEPTTAIAYIAQAQKVEDLLAEAEAGEPAAEGEEGAEATEGGEADAAGGEAEKSE